MATSQSSDRTTRRPARAIAFPGSDRPVRHRGVIALDGMRSRRAGRRDYRFQPCAGVGRGYCNGDRTQLAEQVGACSSVANNRRTRNRARPAFRSCGPATCRAWKPSSARARGTLAISNRVARVAAIVRSRPSGRRLWHAECRMARAARLSRSIPHAGVVSTCGAPRTQAPRHGWAPSRRFQVRRPRSRRWCALGLASLASLRAEMRAPRRVRPATAWAGRRPPISRSMLLGAP